MEDALALNRMLALVMLSSRTLCKAREMGCDGSIQSDQHSRLAHQSLISQDSGLQTESRSTVEADNDSVAMYQRSHGLQTPAHTSTTLSESSERAAIIAEIYAVAERMWRLATAGRGFYRNTSLAGRRKHCWPHWGWSFHCVESARAYRPESAILMAHTVLETLQLDFRANGIS